MKQILFLVCIWLVGAKTVEPRGQTHFISEAQARGAVCLDGSPGAYSLESGFGSGSNSWLVYLRGGGLCRNVSDCHHRTTEPYGSSKNMTSLEPVSGILENESSANPDFFNWNRVLVWYCDGAAYSGDVEAVDPSTNLHFRGGRIFSAIVEELLQKGLKSADNAILTGCSAGGLGTIIHCDNFRAAIPSRATVKCVADAGYFVNVDDISGHPSVELFMDDLVNLHGVLKNLPPLCRKEMKKMHKKESLCIFPENMALEIKTPIFFVNPQYDFVQIRGELVPSPPSASWNSCINDITKCSSDQLRIIQGFRGDFLNAFNKGVGISTGYFVNGCFDHCQTTSQERWLTKDSPKIKGISIAKAVGDWYFGRNNFKEIGIPYPGDQTCHNRKPPSSTHVASSQ